MAKWGCGDPRWIVEERTDAKNVNNWHWTEKDASTWSKDCLKDLLLGLTFDTDSISVHVTDVSKIEGEATANNRKSRLIFFYEWSVVADWVACYKPSQVVVKGKLEILNMSEEHQPSEVDVECSLVNSSEKEGEEKGVGREREEVNAREKVKCFMRKEGVTGVKGLLGEYVRRLREEYSRDIILPTLKVDPRNGVAFTTNDAGGQHKEGTTTREKKSAHAPVKSQEATRQHTTTDSSQQDIKLNMFKTKKLTQSESFMASPDDLYSIFVDPQKVAAFTRSPPKTYEPVKNGNFSIFDGNITGQFLELVPGKKIIMRWRISFWPADHYSIVTLEFEPDTTSQSTWLKLTQTEVPENYYEVMSEGWYRYYWRPIRDTFGYSPHIF